MEFPHTILHSLVYYSVFSVHCSLFTIHCSLFTVHCSLFTVHCSLFTVHCSLFTFHCSLFTVHCSLSSISIYFLTKILFQGIYIFFFSKLWQRYHSGMIYNWCLNRNGYLKRKNIGITHIQDPQEKRFRITNRFI